MARPPALSRSTRTFPNRLGGDPSAGIADLDPQSSSLWGALIVLVSPFEIFSGSWLHLFSLLAFCLVIILLAIGLRLRALIYTGSAFLFADLFGMVLRSTVDHPGMLWIAGLGIGVTVIALPLPVRINVSFC